MDIWKVSKWTANTKKVVIFLLSKVPKLKFDHGTILLLFLISLSVFEIFMMLMICEYLWSLVLTNHQYHEYLKNGKRYQQMSENRPPKHAHFTSILIVFYGLLWCISKSMVLGDGRKMLLVTEEQDHEWLCPWKKFFIRW